MVSESEGQVPTQRALRADATRFGLQWQIARHWPWRIHFCLTNSSFPDWQLEDHESDDSNDELGERNFAPRCSTGLDAIQFLFDVSESDPVELWPGWFALPDQLKEEM